MFMSVVALTVEVHIDALTAPHTADPFHGSHYITPLVFTLTPSHPQIVRNRLNHHETIVHSQIWTSQLGSC
jgi:hypothetical protein